MTKVKTIGLSLAVITALGFSGCGSSSDDDSNNNSSSNKTVSGKVADGYLDKAKVCLDKNENGKCDTDEPSTLSVNGDYNLSVKTTDVGKYPILVEVTTSTIDLDDGNFITKPYTLTAPKDSTEFISPITTLIKGKIAQNPALTTTQALQIISKDLNLTSSDTELLADYVKNEDTNLTDKKLHEIGKVIALLLAKSYDKVKNNLNTDLTNEQKEAIKSLIIRNINNRISTLAVPIKNGSEASGLTSNINTIVSDINITTQKIKIESQKIDLKKNAEIKTFADMKNITFYHFFKDDDGSLTLESWIMKNDGKEYDNEDNATSLTTLIIAGKIPTNYTDNFVHGSNYTIENNNSVVFDHPSGTNPSGENSYTTRNTKILVMDLSKKNYTISDIMYLSIDNDINNDSVTPADLNVSDSKLNTEIPFKSGDILMLATAVDRTTGKYHGQWIDFNEGAMNRILATLKD